MSVPNVKRVEITNADMLWTWIHEHHEQPESILLVTQVRERAITWLWEDLEHVKMERARAPYIHPQQVQQLRKQG